MNKLFNTVEQLNELAISTLNISGIFLSGSLANNTFDSYSDIDLRYIVNSHNIKDEIIKFKEALENTLSVSYFEPCNFDNAIIVHFKDFFKADIFFYTKQMLEPSPYLLEIKILYDEHEFLLSIKENSKGVTYYTDYDTINYMADKYIASAHECYRRIKRGEYIYANQLLQNMKQIILNLEDALNSRPQQGFYKAEYRFGIELLCLINETISISKDYMSILMKINNKLFSQLKQLNNLGYSNRNIENDKYLIIDWFIHYEKPC